jgi:HEAT repeat protein
LAQINDPRVRPAMIEALTNNSTAVRIAALGTLERLADANAYPKVEKLLRDHDANVRGAAIEAALRCGGARAVPALIACLKDKSWEVRQAAANALGVLGERSAVEGLCGLINDPDRDVREKAIIALGQIRDPRAIVPLVPAMLDPESSVRAAAANTLHRLDAHWEKSEGINQVAPIILKAMNHQDYWVSHSAAKLIELLKIDPNHPPAETPAVPQKKPTLEIPAHPAFEILADMLGDRDRDFRLAAAVALRGLREKRAGSLLAAAAQDVDEAVRQAAQSALAALN